MLLRLLSIVLVCGLCASAFSQPFLSGLGQPVMTDSSDQIAEKILNSPIPVLVDFWAAWCGPCKLLNPIFKKLEKEYKGKVLFMKVNVDYHRRIAGHFRIQGIPAVFIIKDKAVQNALVGLQPEEAYRRALNQAIVISDTTVNIAKSQKAPAKEPDGKKMQQ